MDVSEKKFGPGLRVRFPLVGVGLGEISETLSISQNIIHESVLRPTEVDDAKE